MKSWPPQREGKRVATSSRVSLPVKTQGTDWESSLRARKCRRCPLSTLPPDTAATASILTQIRQTVNMSFVQTTSSSSLCWRLLPVVTALSRATQALHTRAAVPGTLSLPFLRNLAFPGFMFQFPIGAMFQFPTNWPGFQPPRLWLRLRQAQR